MNTSYFEKHEFLISREKEIEFMNKLWEEVIRNRKPVFLLIEGDPGVGKSALIEHFLYTKEKDKILIGKGRCTLESDKEGFIPFRQLLIDIAKNHAQFKTIIYNIFDFIKTVAPTWVKIINQNLGEAMQTTVEQLENMDKHSQPKLSSLDIYSQYIEIIKKITDDRPTILFIEDLQWIDKSSLGLLLDMSKYYVNSHTLFLGAIRTVEAFENREDGETIKTGFKNLANSKRLKISKGISVPDYVSAKYPNNNFPDDFLNRVQRQTEGYALFVNELFSYLESEGIIFEKADHDYITWEIKNIDNVEAIMPEKINDLIDLRIESISDQLKDILTHASIEGEDFTTEIIIKMLAIDELKILNDINILDKNFNLIHEQGEKKIGNVILDFYKFNHRFIRERIYEQLSSSQKKILHHKVAECLEQIFVDKNAIAGQLTRHFEIARNYQKAAEYALLAAQFEKKKYSFYESNYWSNKGLEILEQIKPCENILELEIDLLAQLAENYSYEGKFKESIVQYNKAIEASLLFKSDPQRIIRFYSGIADCCDEIGDFNAGLKYIEKAKKFIGIDRGQLSEDCLSLLTYEAMLRTRINEYETSKEIINEVICKSEKMPQTEKILDILIEAYNTKAITISYLGNYIESIELYKRAVEISKKTGNLFMCTICLSNLADDYCSFSKLEEANKAISESISIAIQIGDYELKAYALVIRGEILLKREIWDEAILDLKQAIPILEKGESIWGLGYAYADLSFAYLNLENFEAAKLIIRKGLENSKISQSAVAYLHYVLGRVETKLGNYNVAEDSFKKSIELFLIEEDKHKVALSMRYYAELLIDIGKKARALEMLGDATEIFKDKKLDLEYNEIIEFMNHIEKNIL